MAFWWLAMLDIPTKIKYAKYELTVRNVKNKKEAGEMSERKMKVEELIQYLETMMKDEFIAKVVREEDGLHVKFVDGAEFTVKVEACWTALDANRLIYSNQKKERRTILSAVPLC